MDIDFLDNLPIWAIYAGLGAVLLGAHQLGYARFTRRAKDGVQEPSNTFVQGTIFALITFMLGFTFSMAGGYYEKRRALLIEHAIAISTAYAETAFIGEAEGTTSRDLYHQYTTEIVWLERQAVTSGQRLRKAEALLAELWDIGAAYTVANPGSTTVAYSNSLVAVADLHKERFDRALWLTVPNGLILQLFLLTAFALFSIGTAGILSRNRQRLAIPIVYAVVFALIIDLNRPYGGLFGVSQQPVLEVLEDIETDLGLAPAPTSES